MKIFDKKEIVETLAYPELVQKLKSSFCEDFEVPERIHYNYQSGKGPDDSTLLLMPAWKDEQYVGLKILTVSPYNSGENLPTIQGIYILMDAGNGHMLAQFDAKSLTNLRTAAASALASQFLSKKQASSMLMIGTGALAPEMIKAHCSVRPIRRVYIWGRDAGKARKISEELLIDDVEIVPIKDLKDQIASVDIISSATSSRIPLVFGADLKAGQHVDLVGAFKPNWREADDLVVLNSSVFVDTRAGSLKESGELLIPIKKGLYEKERIKGDLFELCRKEINGRTSAEEITCFISVGYALEDFVAGVLVWEKYLNNRKE